MYEVGYALDICFLSCKKCNVTRLMVMPSQRSGEPREFWCWKRQHNGIPEYPKVDFSFWNVLDMTLIGFHVLSLVHKMGTLWVKKKDGYPSFLWLSLAVTIYGLVFTRLTQMSLLSWSDCGHERLVVSRGSNYSGLNS